MSMSGSRRELPAPAGHRPHSPPAGRPRLPPLAGALDSSDDSARLAGREYRSRQAKRRRRAKQAAERAARLGGGPDSADSGGHRYHGVPDDSAAGDTYRRQPSADDATYRREISAGDTTYRREPSLGDTSYRRQLSADPSSLRGDLSADLSFRRDTPGEEPASEAAEMSITDELSRLGEEVRSGSEAGGDQPPSLVPELVPHPPVTKLYVEKGNRFQATKRQAAVRAAGAAYSRKSQACAVDLALQTQRVFSPLGRLCAGLFAGLALGHLMFILALTGDSSLTLDFVTHYSELALPFRAVFFTLSVVCCVATLDRYDISRASAAQLRRSLTLQDGGVTVLLYLSSLALSCCLAPVDDRFHLYRRNRTLAGLWGSTEAVQRDCRLLIALCAARAAVVLLAWLVVAANPAMDRVLGHLRRLSQAGGGEREATVATVS